MLQSRKHLFASCAAFAEAHSCPRWRMGSNLSLSHQPILESVFQSSGERFSPFLWNLHRLRSPLSQVFLLRILRPDPLHRCTSKDLVACVHASCTSWPQLLSHPSSC